MSRLAVAMLVALVMITGCNESGEVAVKAVESAVEKAEVEVAAEFDNPPKLLEPIDPEYPAEALKAGLSGDVLVETTVDEMGVVTDVKVIEGVDDILDDAACSAIRKAKFDPAKKDGQPVASVIAVPVRFSLDDSSDK